MPQLTQQQVEFRMQGIGSSEGPAVAGLNPWRGPLDVWLSKTGRAEDEDEDTTGQKEMGHGVEELICRRALRHIGADEPAIFGETLAHPLIPVALATPDYVLRKRRAQIECKLVGYRVMHHWDSSVTDDRGLPDYVNAQCQQQMAVHELPLSYVAAWIGARDFVVYEVHYDREVADALLQLIDDFWRRYVLTDTQPPVDGTLASDRWLSKRFARATEKKLVADADAEAIVAAFRQAKIVEREAKARSAALANQVKALMGEASILESSLGTVTWKQDRLGKVAWGDLLRSLPRESVDPFRSPPGRRLLTPKTWGAEHDE